MAVTLKPLAEQVVVITGASSGIGLATARSAARRGAKVVLTARSTETLADVAREINEAGGQAGYVAADVAERSELSHVAEVAIDRFGGFDTWVNNAGVGMYGRLDQTNVDEARRLFDTNFWGAIQGSLLAAEYLRNRGGAIVNVGSVASDNAIPMMGFYSASKHALKGFTDALRMELDLDEAPVSVTLVKPTSIDTPFPQHARNYSDREPDVPPPVYQPDDVAYAILHACENPVRDIFVGSSAKIISALGARAPQAVGWISENVMVPRAFRDEPARHPEGTLDRPRDTGQVYGDHPGFVRPMSVYTRASLHPYVTAAAAAVAVVAGAAIASRLLNEDGHNGLSAGHRRNFLESLLG